MKLFPTFALTVFALMLASCVSPIAKRIEHNPEIFNALSQKQQSLVQTGQVQEGMSKQAVFLSWGRPDRAAKGSKQGKSYERWSYTGYDAVPSSFGYGYGGSHLGSHRRFGYCDPVVFYEPVVSYIPYEAKRVEFLNNRVSGWSVVK